MTRPLQAVLATAAAIALVLGAVAVLTGDGAGDGGPSSSLSIVGAPDGSVLAAGLETPASCEELASTMQALRAEHADQYGYGVPMPMAAMADDMAEESTAGGADGAAPARAAAGEAELAATDAGGGADADSTNVQEAGVDEPDVVERVGDHVVVASYGTVRVVDVVDGEPVERGSLALTEGWSQVELFAIGQDRVAVLVRDGGGTPVRPTAEDSYVLPGGWSTTTVVLLDLADPTAPRELSRVDLEGWLVDARAVDGVLRLAVRSEGPQVDVRLGEFEEAFWEREASGEQLTDEDYLEFEQELSRLYEERRTEALAQLDDASWQPHARVDGDVVPMVGCDRIGFPTSFAGLGTLTLASIDATGETLAIDDAEAVVTAGENLYATADRVVVATARWIPCCDDLPVDVPAEEPPAVEEPSFEEGEAGATAESLPMIEPGMSIMPWGGGVATTDLHVFDVDGTLVTHVASGSVTGGLLNQFAMSIHEGVLRVASTGVEDGTSESYVTTFRVEGTELVQLGQVGDLGPTETIRSVRFMGDTAYVVTFRQTDPLYVVDLADPASPRTRGELKIEGYSAYLHPLGDGQLLGVGQDADPETGFTRGVQVSTFDVTDPTAPTRIDVDVTPESNSEVEWDHHALTVTDDRLAFVPIEVWGGEREAQLGALVYEVDEDGTLRRVGVLDTGSRWELRPRRTLDLGEVLLTTGEGGVVTWDRTTFEPLGTLLFPEPRFEGGEEVLQDAPARDGGTGDASFDDAG